MKLKQPIVLDHEKGRFIEQTEGGGHVHSPINSRLISIFRKSTIVQIVYLILFLLTSTTVYSQISRVGLTQKFDESTLIVEAEVLDKETFICNNGYVCERSTLKIYQTIKGISDTRVHLITFGGKHGDTFQTWSHAAQVSKGQKFIAFLVPFDNACGELNDFEFFSGSQGKYSYQGNDALLSITCPSENYKSPQEFYDRITELSGHSFSPVSINCRAADGQNCLEFLFEVSTPNPSDPLLSEVVVYIRSSNGPKLISKPVFGVKYNPDILGENVVDSGVITLEDIGISNHYNYNSILENIAPDEVRISVDASNLTAPQLVQITDVFTELIKVKISLPGFVDPGILINEETTSELSRYFDFEDGIEKFFDCIRIDGELETYVGCNPEITSVMTLPLNGQPSAAGVDLLLVISGTCFGSNENGLGTVEFTSSHEGPDPQVWVKCFPQDIFAWNPMGITVVIPSISDDSNGYTSGSAGTGSIRLNLNNDNNPDYLAIDPDDIAVWEEGVNVEFSWMNSIGDPIDDTPNIFNHSLPHHLLTYILNQNDDFSGYYFYFDENFPSEYKPAFERALDSWRCNEGTRVSVELFDFSNLPSGESALATKISMGSLPLGNNGTIIIGGAIPNTGYCSNSDGEQTFLYRNKSEIIFNSNYNWHYEEEQPSNINVLGLTDFESVALHEIGHWHGLQHSNNEEDVMFWLMTQDAPYKRELDQTAINGGSYIIEQSINNEWVNQCGFLPHGYYNCTSNNQVEEAMNEIRIFPVPSSSEVIIDNIPASFVGESLYIYDVHGKRLSKMVITGTRMFIDCYGYSSGMYFIQTSVGTWSSKFVVE